MKTTLCAAAFTCAAALITGCAGTQASLATHGTAPSKSAAYYCVKDNLAPDGTRLSCNWQASADEACKFANSSVLMRDTLGSDPQPAGRCNTGQWLVKVTPR
jgi:hypothetical protein